MTHREKSADKFLSMIVATKVDRQPEAASLPRFHQSLIHSSNVSGLTLISPRAENADDWAHHSSV
jgi:hypothetical protein